MTLQRSVRQKPALQRARGVLSFSAVRHHDHVSRLRDLRQEGSYRAIFPRPSAGILEAVAINTAGGVTGGDQFSISAVAQENAKIAITTQAAERLYKAAEDDTGQIVNRLKVAKGAQLFWLPQETILFDGCNVRRKLDIDVDATGSALVLEALVFGREASGETIQSCKFRDCVSITSNSQPIYLDRIKLDGNLATSLARPAIAGDARAMASLVLVAPDAARMLGPCRKLLPSTAGASLLSNTLLVVRMLARDSFALRKALLPLLTLLTDNTVPKNWRL